MPLVWRLGEGGRTGNCPRCIALEGKKDGDTWSSDNAPGPGGPPPLHEHCTCWLNDEMDAQDFLDRVKPTRRIRLE